MNTAKAMYVFTSLLLCIVLLLSLIIVHSPLTGYLSVLLAHNIMNEKDVPKLENIGVKVILTIGNSVADIKRQIKLFGELLLQSEKASQLIANIDDKVAELSQSAEKVPVLLVYGASGTFMAALPSSLAGDILSIAVGDNIAAHYPQLANYPQYASLDMERIVETNPREKLRFFLK